MTGDRSPPVADAALPHVLVVDDEAAIRELVRRYFEANGFRVSVAGDSAMARAALGTEPIDLVLLDIGLPGEDGLTLTRHLREHWRGAVIIVSGRGDAVERIVGLEVGADDYVSKPFELRELLARARSVLRRTAVVAAPYGTPVPLNHEFGGFRLEPHARRVTDAQGRDIGLTTGEFDLLLALVENPNRVLSRDQLMERIHGRSAGPFDRGIDVRIGRLRQKIEADPSRPALIKSVRGAGYLFTATVVRR
jgi:two-component system OmpR family response regulator